ncbi:ABC transporter ATP-binding protein [Halalkalicoccus salilacus]|uniref:ABC transporter ATP-binding protein n=1 Tax=Halalkalicoccus salilacus TaxID=3117459 RepID=UPI00300F294B
MEVEDLSIRYETDGGAVHAVDGVSFTVDRGETYGLVGESGCGKTTLGRGILRLLDRNAFVESGEIWFDATLPGWADENGQPRREMVEDDAYPVRADGMTDLAALDGTQIRDVRWRNVALIPQNAMNALNPVYRVGDQIVEAIARHEPATPLEEAHGRARELLDRVGIEPGRADDYAHELSGGTRQRAVIAMAVACHPELLIADEPTTALDVITQDRVLGELDGLQEEFGVSVLLVSHDVSVVAEACDRMAVMYGGKIMESGPTRRVLEESANPYTLGLRNAVPSLEDDVETLISIPGSPPDLEDPADRCRFAERCPFATDVCGEGHPPTYDVDAAERGEIREATADRQHRSACHRLDVLERMREEAHEERTWQRTQESRS